MESFGFHNTPALILTHGLELLHIGVHRRRGLLLRFFSTEQATSLGLGGQTEFLGQSKRRSIGTPLCTQRIVGLRVHTTGSVRQDCQVRGENDWRFGGEGAAAFSRVPTDVVEAGRVHQIRKSLRIGPRAKAPGD